MSVEGVFAAFHVETWREFAWVMVGLTGQLLFSMRFIVQWVSSERARASVIPVVFWWFSIAGGVVLFSYAVWRQDPVFIIGQSTGLVIYSRNLWLIYAGRHSPA